MENIFNKLKYSAIISVCLVASIILVVLLIVTIPDCFTTLNDYSAVKGHVTNIVSTNIKKSNEQNNQEIEIYLNGEKTKFRITESQIVQNDKLTHLRKGDYAIIYYDSKRANNITHLVINSKSIIDISDFRSYSCYWVLRTLVFAGVFIGVLIWAVKQSR